MDKVQCVVVGAGPSGSACALSLARKGIETVLLERGQRAGEKNVASFVLMTPVLDHLIPGFRDEAPLERLVSDHCLAYLGEKDLVQLRWRLQEHTDRGLAYTAYRSKFDAWFAGKAEEAGAELLTGVLVTDIIRENGKVAGVRIGDEELRADIVVGADGIHTVVGRAAGLVEDDPRTYLLGVKEILDLPPEVLEERFQLAAGEGICYEMVGYAVEDIMGATTLYTNKDSVSLAIFGWVDQLRERGIDLHDRLQRVKEHPYVASLVAGAELREYQAHIISNGGRMDFTKLYSHGVLLCGEAGGFNDYAYIGVPPGMLSGMMAAETAAAAVEKGDFSAAALSGYIPRLEKTGLTRLLYNSRTASRYLVDHGRANLPGYLDHLVRIMGGIFEDEVTYLDPEPYAFARDFYHHIAENSVPRALRRPLRAAIKAFSPLASAMRKRKIRKAMR
ncbi:MAG: FAD-dependent oxidoreductase [Actinobacteria bacterium]|jgi:electron transfer flavoprotein-quinone oxidoreductase|nr:MAG: FAD-dependent oxidoreductase [Actinomycetota bacterium]